MGTGAERVPQPAQEREEAVMAREVTCVYRRKEILSHLHALFFPAVCEAHPEQRPRFLRYNASS